MFPYEKSTFSCIPRTYGIINNYTARKGGGRLNILEH